MARFHKLEKFMDEQNALPIGTQRFRRNTTTYKLALEAVENYPAQVNTVKSTGSGKYTHYDDNTSQTFMLLKMAGFLFIFLTDLVFFKQSRINFAHIAKKTKSKLHNKISVNDYNPLRFY